MIKDENWTEKTILKKSFKARTTGAAKRKVKSDINPLYGKKGIGYINNPKKALYNKTTFSTNPISKSSGCLGGFLIILAIPVAVIVSIISLVI
ncbi:hypothetical protein PMY38_03005 [Clostridium tertium]|uniref:hypothetical protein n=1 Tax=Clostridium tertium TaxID=1559 RepID=UPI00232EA5D0|nr:hypothetical protein [Clostridium tertium]MDB1955461.1 hypothetical protein [Clostridium tertium]MDB1957557.1 hypothetical protein [Clostridium tertium]MDB1962699.1 hypothetical protein [Clostridium tertium]MDB1966744.1 hypothetical protein [Clostridium tertium]